MSWRPEISWSASFTTFHWLNSFLWEAFWILLIPTWRPQNYTSLYYINLFIFKIYSMNYGKQALSSILDHRLFFSFVLCFSFFNIFIFCFLILPFTSPLIYFPSFIRPFLYLLVQFVLSWQINRIYVTSFQFRISLSLLHIEVHSKKENNINCFATRFLQIPLKWHSTRNFRDKTTFLDFVHRHRL
jgi:hypothetical protein